MASWLTFLAVLISLSASSKAAALNQGFGAYGGYMQQPTSSYYHEVFGGHLDIATENQSLFLRLGQVQRPTFHAAGFSDKETHHFALLGHRLLRHGPFSIDTGAGYGTVTGFLHASADSTLSKREFSVHGGILNAEALLGFSVFEIGLSHQLFVGLGTKEQREVYVAWPYHFVFMRGGVSFTW